MIQDKLGRFVHVRGYAAGDLGALEAMYAAFEPKRVAQGLPPHTASGLRRWLDRVLPRGLHYVVELDGRLVGHAMLIPVDGDPDAAELANFLHQDVRNRGIGTLLNGHALAAALAAGYGRVWLSVEPSNRAAIRSYEKVGFRHRVSSRWAPELEMEVSLTSAWGASPRMP